MATIVGDKLKLSNYSYLLNKEGTGFIENFQVAGNRTREEKIVDAVDIDWRPFRFKNFAYVSTPGKATYTYVTAAGDLFDTERLIDWISYSYSMGFNLRFHSYLYHNDQDVNKKRPNIVTNIGWIDRDSRIIGYTYWPAVGSIYNIDNLTTHEEWDAIYNNHVGEIFNDYTLNEASGQYSHAEGFATRANNDYAHAEGFRTFANGLGSHSEGLSCIDDLRLIINGVTSDTPIYRFNNTEHVNAANQASHAEGAITQALGTISHAEGLRTFAVGVVSHAEGALTYSNGHASHSEGQMTYAINIATHAEGGFTYAKGEYSHASGYSTSANADFSHAEGYKTIADGTYTHVEGNSTKAEGSASHAEGISTVAHGNYSHAEGSATLANGNYSHAEGQQTESHGVASHAEGFFNKTYGNYSHIEGSTNISNSDYSHVEGSNNNESNSNYSHVEGKSNTITNSPNSHISGENNTVNNSQFIVASGKSNVISYSEYSIVQGISNTLKESSKYSQLIGSSNILKGDNSFIFGTNITCNGEKSFIFGNSTYSNESSNIIFGQTVFSYGQNNRIIGNQVYVATNAKNNVLFGDNIESYSTSSSVLGHNIKDSSNKNSFSIGQNVYAGQTTATAKDSTLENVFAFGYNIYSYKSGNFTIGNDIANKKIDSFAIGKFITNDGNGSFGIGQTIKNIGTNTYAFGQDITNTGNDSFGLGKTITNTGNGGFGIGKSITNTGANSYAFGQDITNTGVNSFGIGKNIKNQVNGDFGAGYDITNSGINTYSFGQNITNKGNNSFAIGTGITTLQHADNPNFVIGKYNKELTVGYFFTLGYGTSNTDRKNAITTTNTGWTYIGALATYINNINFYNEHKPIAYGVEFVEVFSYRSIQRSSYNTIAGFSDHTNAYNICTNSYILPTKQYVDKILEVKDAFRFAGIYTPDDTDISFAQTKESNNVSASCWQRYENVTYSYENPDKTESTVNVNDFSKGAVWRVDKRGWFGNRVVEAGDLLVSYSDAATNTSGDNWAIIETHMNWVNNTGAYMLNANVGFRFLSNLHLTDSGMLSYSYAEIHHAYVSNQHNGFLTNLSVVNNGKNIQISYVHTYFQNQNVNTNSTQSLHNAENFIYKPENKDQNEIQTNEYFKKSNDVDSIRVINNINVNANGKLCYAYLTVNNLRMHHNNLGYYATTYNIDTGVLNKDGDYIDLVDNVNLSKDGTLSYTRSHYINIRNHHHTYSEYNNNGTNYRTGKTEVNTNVDTVSETNDNYKVLSYAYINSGGTVYTYYYTLDHLRHHHHTYSEYNNDGTNYRTGKTEVNTNVDTVSEANDNYKVLSYAYTNSSGTLYTYYYTLSNLRYHHHTNALSNNGGTLDVNNHKNKYEIDFNAYTSTYNKDDDWDKHRVLSYAWINQNGIFQAYYYTLSNLSAHHDTGKTNGADIHTYVNKNGWTQIVTALQSTETNEITFIDGLNLNVNGKLTYHYTKIDNLRQHHTNNGAFKTAYDICESNVTTNFTDKFGFISQIQLDSTGRLTYEYSSIDNLKTHHGGSHGTHTADVTINFSGTFTFIDRVELNQFGHLSGESKSITMPKISISSINTYTPGTILRNMGMTGGTSTEAKFAYVYDNVWGTI